MDQQSFYNNLMLPAFAPPSWLFGVVWPFLYLLILISFGYGFWQTVVKRRLPRTLFIPMGINLIANILYMPLFFIWQLPGLATVDILIVLVSIVGVMKAWWPHRRWVALMQLPYLAWVAFATVLQLSIIGLSGW